MSVRRVLTSLAITATLGAALTAVAPAATAAPKACPPGQTATVTVVGTELVQTCRLL